MTHWLMSQRRAGHVCTHVPVPIQTAAVAGLFHQLARMVQLQELPAGKVAQLQEPIRHQLTIMLEPRRKKR